MINHHRPQPPIDLADATPFEAKRETHIRKTQFNEFLISQRREGVLQVISLDEGELKLVLESIQKLLEDK